MNESMPKGFKRLKDGIFYVEDEESGKPPEFVCAHLHARARTVDEQGKWGLLLEFFDHAGQIVRVNATAPMIRSPSRLAIKFEEAGLRVGYAPLFAKFIQEQRPTQIIRETPSKTSEQLVIEKIREFLIKNQKKFQGQGDQMPLDRSGFLINDEICFTGDALRLASGITATRSAKILNKAGLLRVNELSHLTKKTKTSAGELRLYCVSTSILEYDTPTLSTPVSKHAPPVSGQKPRFDPDSETSETRIRNGLTPETPVLCENQESEEIDTTNPVVTNIEKAVMIDTDYQPSLTELDFFMTVGSGEYEYRGDKEDDLAAAALAAFYHEEGDLKDSPERHA